MEESGELTEASKDIKNKVDDTSWFRDTPYYWAEASLPLAYAVACVEVVSKSSEKASVLYNLFEAKIYHHCTNIGMFAIPCVRYCITISNGFNG